MTNSTRPHPNVSKWLDMQTKDSHQKEWKFLERCIMEPPCIIYTVQTDKHFLTIKANRKGNYLKMLTILLLL